MTAESIDYQKVSQPTKGMKDYLNTLWRRKYQAMIVGFILLIIVVSLALGLPSIYRSSSTILIEQQEIPQDLVRTTITSYADQRIQVISQRVMTSLNLWEIIKKFELYKDMRKEEPRELVLKEMRDNISLDTLSADVVDPRSGRPIQATIAFTLAFKNKSPSIAQKVANELTSLFLKENLKSRTQMATDTSRFLEEETRKLSLKITDLETRLAEFKEKNVNNLPELAQLNQQTLQRTEREAEEVEREINMLRERKIYLESQLGQITPSSSVISETGERVLSPAGRLKVLKTEYLRLSAVYSKNHPEIKRLNREISALETEVEVTDSSKEIKEQIISLEAELLKEQEHYSEQHPVIKKLQKQIGSLREVYQQKVSTEKLFLNSQKDEVVGDNPVFIQLKTQLEATETELLSLYNKKEKLNNKMVKYELRLIQTPQIEKDYRTLLRDYDNALIDYKETKSKLVAAQLAESMEIGRKGERFTLIEPPILPQKPVSPNRTAILILGFFFSIILSIGFAILLDTIDGRLHGQKIINHLIGESSLSVIPYIMTNAEIKKRKTVLKLSILLLFIFTSLIIILFHIFIMPIDTLWYILARRFGV